MDRVHAVERFRDRTDAGEALGLHLAALGYEHPVVLGLARGGVPVAFAVARALHAPLDVLVVRKLGVPYNPEFAFGAISDNGVRVLNDDVVTLARLSSDDVAAVEARERLELARRNAVYRADHASLPLEGRDVIVVDDGLATGATALAATAAVRRCHAARIIVAVPVASADAVRELAGHADAVIALRTPENFSAVGQWYDRFDQTSDKEVIDLLAASRVSQDLSLT